MVMSVIHNGIEYTNIIQGQVSRSIKAISGEFIITTSANESQALPVKRGDTVQVNVDKLPVCTGYIETISGSYSASSHTITFTGRDKTADIIDSCLKGNKEFNAGINLVSIIQTILSQQGITGIAVKNQAGILKSFTDSSSAQVGQKIFDFIESLARKSQVLLTTDGLGNIVITRGASTPSGIVLLNKLNDPKNLNNIKASNFHADDSERFYEYHMHSQGNPVFSLQSDTPERMVGILGKSNDNQIRKSRYMEFFAEESMNDAQTKQRAIWEANIRRARSFRYSATVQGHTINGTPWSFNQIVKVQDDFWDIAADLLISDLIYYFSLDEGSTTELNMTYPDAFTLESNLDGLKSKTQKLAPKFTI